MVTACGVEQETIDTIREIMLEDVPVAPDKGKSGCGGSIAATSSLIALLSIAGISAVTLKKRKED